MVSKGLYPHIYKFTDDTCDEAWLHVFIMCLHLNTALLGNLKHEFIESAVSFWGMYGGFLNQRLSIMADLTEICVGIDDTEKGYNDMKTVLSSSTFILYDILAMMPYIDQWHSAQPTEVFKTIVRIGLIICNKMIYIQIQLG